MACKVCNDTGRKPGSRYFDCTACGVAKQRRDLMIFSAGISKPDPETGLLPEYEDVLWAVHKRGQESLNGRVTALKQKARAIHDLSVEANDRITALNKSIDVQQAAPAIPEGWRKFVTDCAATAGTMVEGNTLSRVAFRLLAAAPQPPAPEGEAK